MSYAFFFFHQLKQSIPGKLICYGNEAFSPKKKNTKKKIQNQKKIDSSQGYFLMD